MTSLVLRGITRTCFSPQSRRGGSFDLVLAKRILPGEDKSDRFYSSLVIRLCQAPCLIENEKSESKERFKRPVQVLPPYVGFFARLNSTG